MQGEFTYCGQLNKTIYQGFGNSKRCTKGFTPPQTSSLNLAHFPIRNVPLNPPHAWWAILLLSSTQEYADIHTRMQIKNKVQRNKGWICGDLDSSWFGSWRSELIQNQFFETVFKTYSSWTKKVSTSFSFCSNELCATQFTLVISVVESDWVYLLFEYYLDIFVHHLSIYIFRSPTIIVTLVTWQILCKLT